MIRTDSEILLPLGLDSNNILRVKTLSMLAAAGQFTYYAYRGGTLGIYAKVRNTGPMRYYFQPANTEKGWVRLSASNPTGYVMESHPVEVLSSYHFSPHYSVIPSVTVDGSGNVTTSHCLYDQDYFNPHVLTDTGYPALHNVAINGELVSNSLVNGIPRITLSSSNAYYSKSMGLWGHGWFLLQAHGNVSFAQPAFAWHLCLGNTSESIHNQTATVTEMLRNGPDCYYLVKTNLGDSSGTGHQIGGANYYFYNLTYVDQPAVRVYLGNNSYVKFVSWGFTLSPYVFAT